MVSRSKREGGLGIIKMATQNDSLLMKNINKFFNKAGLPWVQLLRDNYYSNGQLPGHWKKASLWWQGILKLLDQYKGKMWN
jgi:hypothetical protein